MFRPCSVKVVVPIANSSIGSVKWYFLIKKYETLLSKSNTIDFSEMLLGILA